MSKRKFSLSFTAGGLLYSESLVVAEAYTRNNCDWGKTTREIEEKNLLQSRTQSTAKRKLREISLRLKTLSPSLLEFLITGTRLEQKCTLWLACCEKYQLLGEFARDVLRAKYLQLDYSVSALDISNFIDKQTLWHEELEGMTPSTISKLQTVMYRMLREAELVTDDGIILAPLISDRFVQTLSLNLPEGLLYFPLVFDNGGGK